MWGGFIGRAEGLQPPQDGNRYIRLASAVLTFERVVLPTLENTPAELWVNMCSCTHKAYNRYSGARETHTISFFYILSYRICTLTRERVHPKLYLHPYAPALATNGRA